MRPPQPSRVPTVVDALVAALRVTPGISVFDGPAPVTPQSDGIAVGAEADASFIVQNQPQTGLQRAYGESVSVICLAWSASGSTTMKPRRDRCAALLEAVADTLRNDPTLGGACDLCWLGPDMEWLQQSNTSGAMCSVGFTVTARTNI